MFSIKKTIINKFYRQNYEDKYFKYYYRCKKSLGGGLFRKILKAYYIFLMINIQKKCNCFIPIKSNIKYCPIFPHSLYGIFISSGATIGKNCVIFQQVTIGSNTLLDSKNVGAPTIGDNVYIGAGAKIIGNIKIGNNVRIGANTTITEDIPDNVTVVNGKIRIIAHKNVKNNDFIIYN